MFTFWMFCFLESPKLGIPVLGIGEGIWNVTPHPPPHYTFLCFDQFCFKWPFLGAHPPFIVREASNANIWGHWTLPACGSTTSRSSSESATSATEMSKKTSCLPYTVLHVFRRGFSSPKGANLTLLCCRIQPWVVLSHHQTKTPLTIPNFFSPLGLISWQSSSNYLCTSVALKPTPDHPPTSLSQM